MKNFIGDLIKPRLFIFVAYRVIFLMRKYLIMTRNSLLNHSDRILLVSVSFRDQVELFNVYLVFKSHSVSLIPINSEFNLRAELIDNLIRNITPE